MFYRALIGNGLCSSINEELVPIVDHLCAHTWGWDIYFRLGKDLARLLPLVCLEIQEEDFVSCLEVPIDILGQSTEDRFFLSVQDNSACHVRKWLDFNLTTFVRPFHRL